MAHEALAIGRSKAQKIRNQSLMAASAAARNRQNTQKKGARARFRARAVLSSAYMIQLLCVSANQHAYMCIPRLLTTGYFV